MKVKIFPVRLLDPRLQIIRELGHRKAGQTCGSACADETVLIACSLEQGLQDLGGKPQGQGLN